MAKKIVAKKAAPAARTVTTTVPVKKKKPDRPQTGKKEVITLDTDPQTISKLDQEGVISDYAYESFLELSDEIVSGLGRVNRDSYYIAKAVSDQLLKQQKEREEGIRRPEGSPQITDVSDRIEERIIGGTATKKTEVYGGRPNTHYCLKPPDELAACIQAGYSFVDSSDPVKTPGMTSVAGSRRISRHGEDELVLLKIPEETYQSHIHAVSSLSKGNREQVRDGFKNEGKRLRKTHHLEYSDETRMAK